MARSTSIDGRRMESYVDTGNTESAEITLGSAGVKTTISIPDDKRGFNIYSSTNNLRYALNQTIEAVASLSTATIPSTSFAVGGVVIAGAWHSKQLPSPKKSVSTDTERSLEVTSLVSGTVFTLELF